MIQLFKGIEATPTQRLVAYMLADAHNEQTGRCDLSVASLAALTSLGERTIQDALKSLEAAGHLSRVFRTGTSTQYNLTPRSSRTPAGDAPPQQPHPGGANAAPPPPQQPHPTPAAAAPNPERTVILTVNEPVPEGASKSPPVAVKVKTPKRDWRDWNREQAEKANAVEPSMLAPADFRIAWQRWREYRTDRAVNARIASEAIEWTLHAAESGLRDCERAAEVHGWPAVIARMDAAQSSGWRGFNFDSLRKPNAGGFTNQRQPKYPAYDASTATLGKTADQISKF